MYSHGVRLGLSSSNDGILNIRFANNYSNGLGTVSELIRNTPTSHMVRILTNGAYNVGGASYTSRLAHTVRTTHTRVTW